VPRGVQHLPVAEERLHLVVRTEIDFEYGNIVNERTIAELEKVVDQ
jgi:hypothetical protein